MVYANISALDWYHDYIWNQGMVDSWARNFYIAIFTGAINKPKKMSPNQVGMAALAWKLMAKERKP